MYLGEVSDLVLCERQDTEVRRQVGRNSPESRDVVSMQEKSLKRMRRVLKITISLIKYSSFQERLHEIHLSKAHGKYL